MFSEKDHETENIIKEEKDKYVTHETDEAFEKNKHEYFEKYGYFPMIAPDFESHFKYMFDKLLIAKQQNEINELNERVKYLESKLL